MRILLSAVAAAVVIGTAAAGAQPASTSTRLDAPRLSEITRGAAFRDATLPRLSRRLAAGFPDTWSYTPTVAGGQTVLIHLSKRYPDDPATAQKWADFFAGLVHGSELADLSAYFLTSTEVQSICGRQALACYGTDRLVAPVDDPSINLSAEAVATHEYGHHVAAHRLNDPWDTLETGTKRWASYEQICAKARSGRLFPGAEDEQHYELNPGEGFAESYRVLNEHRLGLVEAPWEIVSQSLYPDGRALTAIEQDVKTPWRKATTTIKRGSVAKSRTLIVSTPLDGRLTLTLRAASKVQLDLFSPSSSRLGHAAGKTASVSATVCGQRALRVRVSGSGSFRLAISKP